MTASVLRAVCSPAVSLLTVFCPLGEKSRAEGLAWWQLQFFTADFVQYLKPVMEI